MIQKRINLFTDLAKRSRRGMDYLRKVRSVAMVISAISFASLLAVFVVQASLASEMMRIEREKEQIRDSITRELERQLTSHLVGMRVQVVDSALATDIQFASKSAAIKKVLIDNQINAEIISISIPSKKNFTITLEFPSQSDMLEFVKTAEEPEFFENFALVKISDFAISKQASVSAKTKNNTMTISGEFL